ncbi:MAG: YqaJ viral recombinase family protein, partial [Sphaerochaetaceae bacterium]
MINKLTYPSHEVWLELRKEAIGGSDAAAILGLSKWSSPLSVYADKLGLVPPKEDNEQMRQGRDLEEYVAQRFAEQTGLKVRRENHILVNDEIPWMHANIDRRITGELIGLECKTTSVYNRTDFEGGDVPPEYYVQCQHYMAVTGWATWYLAVLVLNKGFYVYKVDRNEDDIAALIESEKAFWNNHIILRIPPQPQENDSETLSKMHPVDDGDFVPLYASSQVLRDLLRKKEQAKNLKKEIESLENEIKAVLGDASEGSDDHIKVTWKTRTSNRFDSTRFKKDHKDI